MDEPWFTYERGRGRHRITPRTSKGWAAFGLFMLVILAPPLAIPILGLDPILFLAAFPLTLVALFFFFRFARSRSEITEPVAAKELAEFREWKRRQGRTDKGV